MALSITDLFTPVTSDQQMATFTSILQTIGFDPTSWKKGGIANTILRAVSITYAGFSQIGASFIKAGFLDTASGDWLTLHARYVFGVERIAATFANGMLTLTNSGGGVYDFNPGDVVALNPTTNKTYKNTAAIHIGAGATVPNVPFSAVELGSASSSSAGTITQLQTTILGVSVTNPASFIGLDAQSDADLQAACRAKRAGASAYGPRGAYSNAIIQAQNAGAPVNINRFTVSEASSTGTVTIYLASPSGAPSPGDVAAVVANIEALARPGAVTVNTYAATVLTVTRNFTVWAKTKTGVAAADIQTAAAAALDKFMKTYPIGGVPKPPATQGYLWATGLEGAIKAAQIVGASGVGIDPAIVAVDGAGADTPLNPGQVAVLVYTITVRTVAVGDQ